MTNNQTTNLGYDDNYANQVDKIIDTLELVEPMMYFKYLFFFKL